MHLKKIIFSSFILLGQNLFGQAKFSEGRLLNKHYSDTIKCVNKFGLKILEVNIKGGARNLVFDTGADIILLSKDSLKKDNKSNSRIADEYNKSSRAIFEVLPELRLFKLNYSNISAMSMELPKPLTCLADGLLGSTIIKKSNWKISKDYFIVSSEPFKATKDHVINYFYFGSGSFYSTVFLNELRYDTCLIDYGSRSELELPLTDFDKFSTASIKINSKEKYISTKWTVNGKTQPDTTIVLNCDIRWLGLIIDSVNVSFSKKNKRPKLGVQIFNRFQSIYINNKSKEISLELPILRRETIITTPKISIDMEGEYFLIDGKIISSNYNINVGDKVKKVNDKVPSDFSSYCAFMEWNATIKNSATITIITNDDKKIVINNH